MSSSRTPGSQMDEDGSPASRPPAGADGGAGRAAPRTPATPSGRLLAPSQAGTPISSGRRGIGNLPRADVGSPLSRSNANRSTPAASSDAAGAAGALRSGGGDGGGTPGSSGAGSPSGASATSSPGPISRGARSGRTSVTGSSNVGPGRRAPTSGTAASARTPAGSTPGDTSGDGITATPTSPGAAGAAGAGAPVARRAGGEAAFLWGTTINVSTTMEAFRSFVRGYRGFMEVVADRETERFLIRQRAKAAHAEAKAAAASQSQEDDEDEDLSDEALGIDFPPELAPEADEQLRADKSEEEPYYVALLRAALVAAKADILGRSRVAGGARAGEAPLVNVAVDCKHLFVFASDEDTEPGVAAEVHGIMKNLKQFPTEIIPIMDMVLNDVAAELIAEQSSLAPSQSDSQSGLPPVNPRIRTRVFNLMTTEQMRQLDPLHIDTLVTLRGMVTRCSAIIPEMRRAFYRCTNPACGASQEVDVDRGRVEDPEVCAGCRVKGGMELVHNRCTFIDKQQVRLQEAPENVPEGETPSQVILYVYEELVDFAIPGDRVTVTGIYRAIPIRPNARQRTVKSVFNTVVDVIHFRKSDREKLEASGGPEPGSGGEGGKGGTGEYSSSLRVNTLVESAEDVRKRVEAMRGAEADPTGEATYERLAASLAPSIYEHNDIKKGLLLQLFGGVNKDLGPEGKIRGEINVLLCGDPGTSKSQFLSYVHRITPRGMYTSGTGSSAVGLTAYVTKDPENRNEFVLESGALVLSDRGVCCIDEFDKMSEATRSIMHEVMEQQTVSIAKAGIIATLNARTSVLASANPVESRYNPSLSVVENIQLPPSLLSRFDLIYLVLDAINPTHDRNLAKHIVSLFFREEDRRREAPELATPPFTRRQLMEYISYAKRCVEPRLSDEAGEKLVAAYVKMRGGNNPGGAAGGPAGRKTIAATTRQLESLIRMSEAHARMRLSAEVDVSDVEEAVRLMDVSTQKAAVDPRTGTIDMNLISTGHSAAQAAAVDALTAALRDLLSGRPPRERLSLGEVMKMLNSVNPDAPDPSRPDLMSALREIANEDDAIITLGTGSREMTVTVTGRGLMMGAEDY